MSILLSDDKKELIANCQCGCDDGIHIKIKEDETFFAFLTYTNGNFYSEQNGVFSTLCKKFKKICAIIRNKDYCYSEVIMTKEDFLKFKAYINSVEIE